MMLLLFLILLPLLSGGILAVWRPESNKARNAFVAAALGLEALLTILALAGPETELPLFALTDTLTLGLRLDGVSKLFLMLSGFGFLFAGVYAFRYMAHAGRETSFFMWFLFTQAALMGMDLSSNLITMYLFFELLTLLSMPMVLHERSPESIRAALKYLFYSIAGAFLALGCIFFLAQYCTTLDFVGGGTLDPAAAQEHGTLLRVVIFLGVVGFGAKAGMYPLHGWLPTAHPVAPAPASAVLSGVVAKAGVLAILRLVYFSVGPAFLQGTWVQYAWLGLACLTVFMGSMMAYREQAFKTRLAYSSVSQISYVLVGLFFLTPEGVTGGLLHVLFHATIKICLFLVAGSFITVLGKRRVDELKGVGKAMPLTLAAFTLASLALIGIPPFSGFVSKWYLASGALHSGVPVYDWLAPVILLVSALLTAGYLLPITIDGFFPKHGTKLPEKTNEGGPVQWLPLAALAVLSLLLGIFSGPLVHWLSDTAAGMF